MKHIYSLILLLFIFSEANGQDTIRWSSNYKLKWEDFQALPDTTSKFIATTMSSIYYSYHMDDAGFQFNVYCIFIKRESWAIDVAKNNHILNHEQLHFDITEIYARKLKKQLKEYSPNRKTLKADIFSIVSKILEEEENMQDLYDSETDFSNNTKMQKFWCNKIKKELDSLDP